MTLFRACPPPSTPTTTPPPPPTPEHFPIPPPAPPLPPHPPPSKKVFSKSKLYYRGRTTRPLLLAVRKIYQLFLAAPAVTLLRLVEFLFFLLVVGFCCRSRNVTDVCVILGTRVSVAALVAVAEVGMLHMYV
jgi:hypothetical protein